LTLVNIDAKPSTVESTAQSYDLRLPGPYTLELTYSYHDQLSDNY